MKRLSPLLSLVLALSLLISACGEGGADKPSPEPEPEPQAGELVQSELARESNPQVPQEDMDTLVDGNTAFALDLYQELRQEEGNLFYSPYSISVALSMTYGGARGDTAEQMASVMHYDLGQEGTHPAFNALDQALASRSQTPVEDGDPFQLNIVNAIWGRPGYAFEPAYLDLLALNYGAGLRLLDFIADPEGSRQAINLWVEEQTQEKIKDLLPEGSIGSDTVLVLTNAIYFNASWANPFEPSATTQGSFQPEGGDPVQVDMMHQSSQMNYAQGEGWQAAELPYQGYELSMVVIAPDAGEMQAFEEGLSPAVLESVLSGLSSAQLDLTMPKFEFEDSTGLSQILPDMGMTDAFTGAADFSGINGTGGLMITDVLHKAFVGVDEAGTEAAAATAVVVGETSAPEPQTLTLDRPFLFLIRDRPSGSILFLGRVSNPAL